MFQLMIISCVSTDVDVSSSLSGIVMDSETSVPLPGCIVNISPGNRSVSTNSSGFYDFGTIDMGEYVLTASLNAYGFSETKVRLEPSKPLYVEILLDKATIPTVSTEGVQDVTGTTASLSGSIISNGGMDLIEAGFYYGKDKDALQKVIANIEGKLLTSTIMGLSPETEYHFKAYARNAIGESVGEIKSFKTTAWQLPEVNTLEAINISATSAILNASIDSDAEHIESCGFYIGKNKFEMTKCYAINGEYFFYEAKNLTPCTQYYYKAFVADSKNEKVGEQKTFTTNMLTYNGIEYVDLGLPSGLKWASVNLGASSMDDVGAYFSWAETKSKEKFAINNYKYAKISSSETSGGTTTNTYEFTKYTSADGLKQLEQSDDAAYAIWNGKWRMPTYEEFKELESTCSWIWTKIDDQEGYKIVGPNGSYIFLPFYGYYGQYWYGEVFHNDCTYYWSSDLRYSTAYSNAYCLKIDSSSTSFVGFPRYYGALVRPVFE